MTSSFRYDGLPVELKLKVLEHAFANGRGTRPIHIHHLILRRRNSYRLCDEYFDPFYNCVIPSELRIFLDPSFRQLFVSKEFLRHGTPIFAKQKNRVEIQMNSYRTTTDDAPGSRIVEQTLKEILQHIQEVTITHTLLARDNHLDVQRLLTLVSPSKLQECNLIIEKPRFWFHDHPDLRTTIVGHLMNFAFHRNNDLRVLSEEEIEHLREDKQPPSGMLDLLQGQLAPSEITWHREELVPKLREHGFTGSAWFQIDIVGCRNSNSEIPLMPTSYLMRFQSPSLEVHDVLVELIGHRFWSRRRGRCSR